MPAVTCTDAVRMVNLSRPDGQLFDMIFWKFRWKSFLFKSRVWTVRHWRPEGRTSATSNFHIRLRASGPRGMNVRTAELQHSISISVMRASGPWRAGVQTVEVESAISILVARASGPWYLNCDSCLMETRVQTGHQHRPDGCIDLPLFWTWKESEAGRSLKVVRTGCWDVWTDASWNRSFSI
jgi:hypothetical protein